MKNINNTKSLISKKTALVLSGGVVKAGAWHLGVALALEDLGFRFKSNHSENVDSLEISTYVGSSAGSLILLYLANGFKPKDIIKSFVAKKESPLKPLSYYDMLHLYNPLNKPPRPKLYEPFSEFPFLLKALIKPYLSISGLFSTVGLKKYLEENIIFSNDFNDYKADIFVVASQLDHSRKVIFSKYNYPSPVDDPTTFYYNNVSVSEAAAASMSVPPFYTPYPIFNEYTGNTDYYIDGEIRDTLSTHVAVDNKCEYIISSWTHTPYHLTDDIGSLINYGLPAIVTQSIYLMIQKKIMTARNRNLQSKEVLDIVSRYFKENNLDNEQRKKILDIIEKKLNYHRNVTFIDICPTAKNYKLFLKNSFSLSPKNSSEIITMGYERTMEVFNSQEWKR